MSSTLQNRPPELYPIDQLLLRARRILEDHVDSAFRTATERTQEIIAVVFMALRLAEQQGTLPELLSELKDGSDRRGQTPPQAVAFYLMAGRNGRYERDTRHFIIAGLEILHARPEMAKASETAILQFMRTFEGGLNGMRDVRQKERSAELAAKRGLESVKRRKREDAALVRAADAAKLPIEDYVAVETRRRFLAETQARLRRLAEMMPDLITDGSVQRVSAGRNQEAAFRQQGATFVVHSNSVYQIVP